MQRRQLSQIAHIILFSVQCVLLTRRDKTDLYFMQNAESCSLTHCRLLQSKIFPLSSKRSTGSLLERKPTLPAHKCTRRDSNSSSNVTSWSRTTQATAGTVRRPSRHFNRCCGTQRRTSIWPAARPDLSCAGHQAQCIFFIKITILFVACSMATRESLGWIPQQMSSSSNGQYFVIGKEYEACCFSRRARTLA